MDDCYWWYFHFIFWRNSIDIITSHWFLLTICKIIVHFIWICIFLWSRSCSISDPFPIFFSPHRMNIMYGRSIHVEKLLFGSFCIFVHVNNYLTKNKLFCILLSICFFWYCLMITTCLSYLVFLLFKMLSSKFCFSLC